MVIQLAYDAIKNGNSFMTVLNVANDFLVNYFLNDNYLFLLVGALYSQEIFTDYLIENEDTIDVFSYQIPNNYNQNSLHPLLVIFHQIIQT